MPSIAAVATVSFPHAIAQERVKQYVRDAFFSEFPQVDRLLGAFDNAEIDRRNLCKPIDYYARPSSFADANAEYVRCTLTHSVEAIERCLRSTGVDRQTVTDILFVSSTGIATPSIDAQIVNAMRLNPHINRMPMWGLGCGAGVSGIARANAIATANPDAVVLLVAAELCSLTFLRNDFSKSNVIASSLFSDGIAACMIVGDRHASRSSVTIAATASKLYYDSLDVMGWEVVDSGLKVLFSKDIPSFIRTHIKSDITEFLAAHGVELDDITQFIFHPGGRKVLDAYTEALAFDGNALQHTRAVMKANGNMSSPTVLYVLERFLRAPVTPGFGLMLAMGPGFSSEMVLLSMGRNAG